MLFAEGFLTADALEHPTMKAFELFRDHLTKNPGYDWGLRGLKQTFSLAGSLLRANPDSN